MFRIWTKYFDVLYLDKMYTVHVLEQKFYLQNVCIL